MKSFYTPYIILAVLWVVYFGLHSGLATLRVKRIFGGDGQRYRLVYSVFATLGLLGMGFYMLVLDPYWLWVQGGWTRYSGMVIATVGIFLVRAAFKAHSMSEMVGLKPAPGGKQPLNTEGILAHVRHPLYGGTVLLVVGFFVFAPNLTNAITAFIWVAYIFVAVRWEEQRLVAEFGEAYERYRQRVPMLFPKRLG